MKKLFLLLALISCGFQGKALAVKEDQAGPEGVEQAGPKELLTRTEGKKGKVIYTLTDSSGAEKTLKFKSPKKNKEAPGSEVKAPRKLLREQAGGLLGDRAEQIPQDFPRDQAGGFVEDSAGHNLSAPLESSLHAPYDVSFQNQEYLDKIDALLRGYEEKRNTQGELIEKLSKKLEATENQSDKYLNLAASLQQQLDKSKENQNKEAELATRVEELATTLQKKVEEVAGDKAALNTLREELTRIGEQIDPQAHEKAVKIQGNLDSLNTSLNTLQGTVNQRVQAFNAAEADRTKLREELNALRDDIQGLKGGASEEELRKLNAQIDDVSDKVQAATGESGEISQLAARIIDLETTLATVGAEAKHGEDAFKKLGDLRAHVDAKVLEAAGGKPSKDEWDEMGRKFIDLGDRFTTLEEIMGGKALQVDLDETNTKITTLETSKASQADLDAEKTRITGLETTLNGKASQADLTNLETRLGSKASQADLNKANEDLKDLETSLGEKASQADLTNLEISLEKKASIGALNQVSTDLTTLKGEMGSKASQADLDAEKTRITGLETTLNGKASQAALDEANTKITTLEASLGEKASQADLTNLETRLDKKASTEDLGTIKTNLEALQTSIDSAVEGSTQAVTSVSNFQKEMKKEITTLISTITDLSQQVGVAITQTNAIVEGFEEVGEGKE